MSLVMKWLKTTCQELWKLTIRFKMKKFSNKVQWIKKTCYNKKNLKLKCKRVSIKIVIMYIEVIKNLGEIKLSQLINY
jgi:hypothetical protein